MDQPVAAPTRANTAAAILAGGEGRRFGGLDKGWIELHGEPLAVRALRNLRRQVDEVFFIANRELPRYRALGVPVWSDDEPGHAGPMMGVLTALRRGSHDWLLIAPVDATALPADLFSRLAAIEGDQPRLVETASGWQPLCALMPRRALHSLEAAWQGGERSLMRWLRQQRAQAVRFNLPDGALSLNTPAELAAQPLRSPHESEY